MDGINIFEYVVGDSFLHRLNPKVKLIAMFMYIVALFFLKNVFIYFLIFLLIVFAYLKCKIGLFILFKNFKVMVPILLISSFLNLFFRRDGEVIFSFFCFNVTKEAVTLTVLIFCRLTLLILGSSLLACTTIPIDFTYAVGCFLKPLKIFHFPVCEASLMMTIALRFIPTLISETEKIICAKEARGVYLNEGNFKKRFKFLISILVPLMVSSFKRADELALAMESRLYCVGKDRTSYRKTSFKVLDLLFLVLFVTVCLCLIFLDYFIKRN